MIAFFENLIGILAMIFVSQAPVVETTNNNNVEQASLPNRFLIEVPFTSQAPSGNWAQPWQDACEETVITMIDAYYSRESLDQTNSQKKILGFIKFKEDNFGSSLDESMKTTSEIINFSDLSWHAAAVTDPSIEDLKYELVEGRPIIVPVYAKELTNPYFVVSGLDYHTVVLVGYDDDRGVFITHDPGTSRGKNFEYSYEEFHGAIHDLVDNEKYEEGLKRVLYTRKK